jgi:DNA modification methylase
MSEYLKFLGRKKLVVKPSGKTIENSAVNPALFLFQQDIVKWSVHKGRCAIFADTGLGKTRMQVEWSRLIGEITLILAPLSVAKQTVKEAAQIGVNVLYCRSMDDVRRGLDDGYRIFITNYEMMEHFTPDTFGAVVLDESSILKSLTGATRNRLIEIFSDTPYRLACTATPAPNDITELANHAEFLGVMTNAEMMATFFTYNAGGTSKSDSWRLKKHAHDEFYRWLASWSVAVKKPSDLGYKDDGYNLPPLNIHIKTVSADYTPPGMLPGFGATGGISAIDARHLRRQTLEDRVRLTAEMVNASSEQWILWCGLNDESDLTTASIPDAVNVYGSMTPDEKADALTTFIEGQTRVLVTKTSIAGFGINMQNCHNMAFVGIDFSFEGYYQAVRRIYRFGQKHPVNVYIVISDQEKHIFDKVMNKEKEAVKMTRELIKASRVYTMEELRQNYKQDWKYRTDIAEGENWTLYLGDSAERMKEIPDNSIDVGIDSPPFGNEIFVYSATERDLGNSRTADEFFEHYRFIIREQFRIHKPGRIRAVHVADGRTLKSVHGYIGRKDFSGDVIDAYTREGWIFWRRVTIDKNAQAQSIRLRDHGLSFSTLEKDSTGLYGNHPDYMLLFKKPGENAVPVTPVQNGDMTRDDWIVWAQSVWTDISESDVLNVEVARSQEDERHMCPLQLPVIERIIKMYSNPNEVVMSSFAGIGSEGYEAVRLRRRFIGVELKPEYWNVAQRNLHAAEQMRGMDLLEWAKRQVKDGLKNAQVAGD